MFMSRSIDSQCLEKIQKFEELTMFTTLPWYCKGARRPLKIVAIVSLHCSHNCRNYHSHLLFSCYKLFFCIPTIYYYYYYYSKNVFSYC